MRDDDEAAREGRRTRTWSLARKFGNASLVACGLSSRVEQASERAQHEQELSLILCVCGVWCRGVAVGVVDERLCCARVRRSVVGPLVGQSR